MSNIEQVAKLLCRCHFARKKHYGACTVEERLEAMVNTHWHGWIKDAMLVIDLCSAMTNNLKILKIFVDLLKLISYIDCIRWREKMNEAPAWNIPSNFTGVVYGSYQGKEIYLAYVNGKALLGKNGGLRKFRTELATELAILKETEQ